MKIVFTNLLLLLSWFSYGQVDFVLEPVPAHSDGTADADEFTAHAMIKNLADHTIVIAWQRTNNDLPNGWQSYICSNITCAPPDISQGTFSLTANDSTNLDCHFKPNDIPGDGLVELRLFLTDDTTQVLFATYLGNASPVSTLQPVRDQIKVYPNPVTDYLQINSEEFTTIELYSSQGSLIQTFKKESSIDTSQLPAGTYYLKIYSSDKGLISVNSFQRIDTK